MMSDIYNESESEIQKFYAERSVFITGVTGLIGKLLLEKLLRSCPDIKKIYLLVRPKKEKSAEKRLETVLNKECFSLLKGKFPNFRDKVFLVKGDLRESLCGISDEHLTALQKDVSIVFHSAANVQFLEPLRISVQANVIGTRHVLEICKTLPQLEAFIHVSTAFVRRNPDFTVPEEVGGSHIQPRDIFNLLSFLDDETLRKITPHITKGMTTYQLSKALAELLVVEEKGHVPVLIVRPCLVTPAWKEPLTGWCDIYQGIGGLAVATGRGFWRTVYIPRETVFLPVPVDIVINCVIASAWYSATKRPEGTFVVNCTLEPEKFLLVSELIESLLKLKDKYPLTKIYRYPSLTYYQDKWKTQLRSMLDHYLPAMIIDSLLLIFTGKPIMVRLYKKMDSLWTVFEEAGKSPWYFCRDNFNKVKNAMSTGDSEIFFLETKTFEWEPYLDDCVRAGRTYLVKEDLSTIPYAAKKIKIWWLVTTVMKWLLILFLIYWVTPQSFLDSVSSDSRSIPYSTKPALEVEADGNLFNEYKSTLAEI